MRNGYPEGLKKTHYGSTNCWGSDSFPGTPFGIDELLKERRGEAAFTASLAQGWSRLPSPYDGGLLYLLLKHGVVEVGAVPPWLVEAGARVIVQKAYASDDIAWADSAPWPAEVLAAALLEACDAAPDYIRSVKVIGLLAGHVPPEALIRVLDKIDYWSGNDKLLPAAVRIADGGPGMKAALEARIATLTGTIQSPDWSHRSFPAYFVGLGYLEICRREGVAPPASQDAFWAELVDKFRMGWSGGSDFEGHNRRLRGLLAQIPAERLGPMLLSASTFSFLLAAAAPTEAVIEGALKALEVYSGHSYELGSIVTPGLIALGTAAVPALVRALRGAKPPTRRDVLIQVLMALDHPDSAEGLAASLGDPVKSVRELAGSALRKLSDVDAVLKALVAPLAARRKDERLIAAQVLAALPHSAARSALAHEALASEKVAEICAIRDAIPAPSTAEGADRGAIEVALVESQGKAWGDFVDQGPLLLDAWMAVLGKALQGQSADLYQPLPQLWVETLAALRGLDEALPAALSFAPVMSRYNGPSYLNRLVEIFGGVAPQVSARLVEGRWERPANFGNHRWSFGFSEALEWLLAAAPDQAGEVLLVGLSDKLKGVVDRCVEALAGRAEDEALLARVEALLGDSKDKARAGAAQVLERAGRTSGLGALKAALDKEKKPAVKVAMTHAIEHLSNLALDLGAFAVGAEGDAAMDAALARLPGNHNLDLSSAPALRWKTGAAMSSGARDWFVALLGGESADQADENLRLVRARLEDAICHALCGHLLNTKAHADRGWRLYMQPVIGSAAHLDAVGALLEVLASSQSTAWGTDGVEVMVRADSDEAIRWLDHWARKTRRDALRWRAANGLSRMALRRGLSVEELIDSAMSRFGFDDAGVRQVQYGGRTLTWTLDLDGQIHIDSGGGKLGNSLPSPRKDDDAAQVAEVKAELTRIRKEIKQILKAQGDRLESAMASGRTWPLEVWRARLPRHPVVRGLARSLVFAAQAEEGAASIPFALDDQGAPVGADGAAVTLAEGALISIAHPVTLSEGQRDAFIDQLLARGIGQPFDQLRRRIFTAAEVRVVDKRFDLDLPLVTEAAFFGKLSRCGYERGGREDAGLIFNSSRTFGPWSIALNHTGVSPEVMDGARADVEVNSVAVSCAGVGVALSELPAVVFSEVVRDLHALSGA